MVNSVVGKPPLLYFGGKSTMGAFIAARLPRHRHYVEAFAGSLAVLFAKQPSQMETVNDLDGAVVNFWRVLRDRPADLLRACALTPHSRAEYSAARDLDGDDADEVERARRLWIRLNQGRSHKICADGWRYDIQSQTGPKVDELVRYLGRMPAAWARLRRVSIECRPAIEVIDTYGADPDVLLYVDPPYLDTTRTSLGCYRHEYNTEEQHRTMGQALRACRAGVVLSGYPSPLYDDDLFADWCRVEYPTHTTQGGQAAPRVEVLWSNRDLGEYAQPSLDIIADHPTPIPSTVDSR